MSLWCILAAPLFAGNDLVNMSEGTFEILTNPDVIFIDQDPAGVQGHRVWQEGPREVWTKPLRDGSIAVALFNRLEYPLTMEETWRDLGLASPATVRDLWARSDQGTFASSFTASVAPHGVVLIRVK